MATQSKTTTILKNFWKKYIFNYLTILILVMAQILMIQASFSEEEDEVAEILASEQLQNAENLENTMFEHTGHRFDSIEHHIKKLDIDHGLIHKSGDNHYLYIFSNDGTEHLFSINKNGNTFHSPAKVEYKDIPDIAHFGLKRRVQHGLKKAGIHDNTQISKAWNDRLLTEIQFNPDNYHKISTWEEILHYISGYPKKVGQHRKEVRKAYNDSLAHYAEKFLLEVNQVGLENVTSETARMYHDIRRELGREFKEITGPEAKKHIYKRNIEKYGDKLGPTYEYLSKDRKKTIQDIAVSSFKSEGKGVKGNIENNQENIVVKTLLEKLENFNNKHTGNPQEAKPLQPTKQAKQLNETQVETQKPTKQLNKTEAKPLKPIGPMNNPKVHSLQLKQLNETQVETQKPTKQLNKTEAKPLQPIGPMNNPKVHSLQLKQLNETEAETLEETLQPTE